MLKFKIYNIKKIYLFKEKKFKNLNKKNKKNINVINYYLFIDVRKLMFYI